MTEGENLSGEGTNCAVPVADEARREQVVAALDRLFRCAGEGEEIRQLYEIVLNYRLEQGR